MGMEQHIEQLKKEQFKAQHELDTIERLRAEFPDLEVSTDRWGRKRYVAKSVNSRVTEVLFHRNCGCCADSPIHARPYLKLEDGTTIYSNPCDVMIGEPTWGGRFREYEDWEKRYWEAGLSLEAVKTIRRYIDRQAEEDDDDDYDD